MQVRKIMQSDGGISGEPEFVRAIWQEGNRTRGLLFSQARRHAASDDSRIRRRMDVQYVRK